MTDNIEDITVVDGGTTYESQESAIIAKEEADKAKLWAQESERQANLASGSADTAAQARDDAVAAKEYAEAAVTDANVVAVGTDLRSTPSNIKQVAENISDVSDVANNISNVNAVADNETNINNVNANKTNIDAVAGNETNINTVAGDKANIDIVAGDKANIDAVAANKTNIDKVATDINRVNLVADDIASVHTVAVDISTVIDVANNKTNIDAVAGDLTNINAVAADLTNIDNASSYASLAEDWANKMDGTVDGVEYSAKYYATQASQGQLQADWSQTDTTAKDYIKNKPGNFVGATSGAAGAAGFVPAPSSGDTESFLKSDGTWGAVGGGLEIGDVGIAPFGIDETLNERRYLNGQVISQTQFVQFTAFLKSRVSVYPSLATTEVNWQAEVTNSKLGQCGKFVIDDDAGTIRLPKVVNINGLQDLTGLGTIKAESLPNITGNATGGDDWGLINADGIVLGAIYKGSEMTYTNAGSSSSRTSYHLAIDASRSSSTYQDNAPVQQEAVQYPYFIQVAEGVETSVDVSREIELNNPFSLLDYKYSEYELSNASWLLSNGQWNSGAVYQSVYNLLLQIYNGTVTKAGVSVKLSTETYADTDFVLNTGDTTFRLPLKVLMAGNKRVAGNGMTLGMTDGTYTNGLTSSPAGYGLYATGQIGDVGDSVPTDLPMSTSKLIGVTTDETKSGIETSANGLYLYFYVGETIQDANIIAAASVLTDVADLKNASNFSSLGKETVVGWGMPDWTAGVSFTSGATVQANGWMYYYTNANSDINTISVDNVNIISQSPAYYNTHSGLFPVLKGQVVSINYPNNTSFTFYPMKGA